jgi:arsenate reductase (glutaredoxin)
MIVYGIKNCNTVKSALGWLNEHSIDFDFHDYKAKGITRDKLQQWCGQVGWEALLNKRGTTWRQLEESVKESIRSEEQAITLMMEKTSVIKRPLIEKQDKVLLLGFDELLYQRTLL